MMSFYIFDISRLRFCCRLPLLNHTLARAFKMYVNIYFQWFLFNVLIAQIIKSNTMDSEVEYLFKGSKQTHAFLKDITNVFFNLKIDVYKSNNQQIWKDVFDDFLIRFENNIYDRISEKIDVSKNPIEDYNALQFFEKMMIRDKLVKKLHPKYEIILDKFTVEINEFVSKFMVSTTHNYNTDKTVRLLSNLTSYYYQLFI